MLPCPEERWLTGTLREPFAESARLEAAINEKLKGLGYAGEADGSSGNLRRHSGTSSLTEGGTHRRDGP